MYFSNTALFFFTLALMNTYLLGISDGGLFCVEDSSAIGIISVFLRVKAIYRLSFHFSRYILPP
ncbi:hypothetical protein BD408DRAFT_424379 [Parasitella parasitica]|nr:hypothetical protein BD408DRAFT_424379 [Parasitella parasitica]